MDSQLRPRGWNIFARELESVLLVHGFRLGHLNDRAHIHPEKVRRLQQSLIKPRFHVLPPEELEHVSVVFGFTDDEQLRLRAAVLATAMEDMLMDRIHPEDAFAAADQIFPLLFQALKAATDDTQGIGAIKGMPAEKQVEFDRLDGIDEALDEIDSALLALHLSLAGRVDKRTDYLHQARQGFISALSKLDQLPHDLRSDQAWIIWHAEAHSGLAAAERSLAKQEFGEKQK